MQQEHGKEFFECPHCRVRSQQIWLTANTAFSLVTTFVQQYYLDYRVGIQDYAQRAISEFIGKLKPKAGECFATAIPHGFSLATCGTCHKSSIWIDRNMVYPAVVSVDSPNEDLAEEIRALYLEAASICSASPKGAAALLRLALQKLLVQIGKSGKHINSDIKDLVAEGLNPKIQQALDVLRVVGNNAVHPGQIDFDDDGAVALQMFKVLNFIADELISKPREMDRLYNETIPPETRGHIQDRDGK